MIQQAITVAILVAVAALLGYRIYRLCRKHKCKCNGGNSCCCHK